MKYLALVACLLAACATEPISTAEAEPGIVLDATLSTRAPGTQAVIVKRDAGQMAGACATTVSVNGSPAGEIRQGQKVTFYLPPGDHMLAARANSICAGGLVETRITVKALVQAVRVGYGSNGEFFIVPTAF